MLQYDRTDVSEGIDINKTSESKECMLCHYWCFKDVGYKFQLYVCNICHAVSLIAFFLISKFLICFKNLQIKCKIKLHVTLINDRGICKTSEDI